MAEARFYTAQFSFEATSDEATEVFDQLSDTFDGWLGCLGLGPDHECPRQWVGSMRPARDHER